MLDMGSPLLDLALVALHPSSQQQQQQQQQQLGSEAAATAFAAPGSLGIDVTGGSGGDAGSGDGGGGTPPRECVLLRWGGLMSVLDLERGSEMALSADVSVEKV